MKDKSKKTYKVIEILNSKELIINYGSIDGARKGHRVIIKKIGDPVTDPDTNEVLGTLDIIKGDLKIYETFPRFSICRDITVNKPTSILDPLGLDNEYISKTYSNLNVEDKDMSKRWPVTTPPIKVGDKVDIIK